MVYSYHAPRHSALKTIGCSMFSGIVETKITLLEWIPLGQIVRIITDKPSSFNNLSIGDSIAVNGVCLTLEAYDVTTMQFALGPETLKVTGWSEELLKNASLNVERSLRLGDQIHGHLVSGHVDAMALVSGAQAISDDGEISTLILTLTLPKSLRALVWQKGSVALNGVSLTVNSVHDLADEQTQIQVCLIPETLRRTNLAKLKVGDWVTVEADQYARAMHRLREVQP
jgi:riboflavin synthase